MKYMGSKARIAKHILPIILKDRYDGQTYVEPFVGGFNMIDKVNGARIASDRNLYVTSLFTSLQDGWIPPKKVSESEYVHIRDNKNLYPNHLVGYVGFNSYAAKFFGGYRRDSKGIRDYWDEHYKHIMKQVPRILGVNIINSDFSNLVIPKNSIVYCDPPYAHTTNYSGSKFPHNEFWGWVRKLSREGHRVYISEYKAPEDFTCVWAAELYSSLTRDTGSKKAIEKLFTLIE